MSATTTSMIDVMPRGPAASTPADVADEVRRHLRLDLHDGLGPLLLGLHCRLQSLRRRLPADEALDELVDCAADAVREARRIVDGLQPSVLQRCGLVPALRRLVDDARDASAIDVTLDVDVDVDVPAALATTCYRVVGEALANAVRHSGGRSCRLHLSSSDRCIEVVVADDGRGLDRRTTWGMGLRSIAARVGAAGGWLAITSASGSGTALFVRLPR